jgi:hypothetical protein
MKADRDQFEAWFARTFGHDSDPARMAELREGDEYVHRSHTMAWAAWQAALATQPTPDLAQVGEAGVWGTTGEQP